MWAAASAASLVELLAACLAEPTVGDWAGRWAGRMGEMSADPSAELLEHSKAGQRERTMAVPLAAYSVGHLEM